MIRFVWKSAKHALRALLYAAVGGFISLVVGLVIVLDSRADLKVWHTAHLDAEFTADSDADDFSDYLALEDRLFAELEEEVYAKIDSRDEHVINRYSRGSLSDPTSWTPNWNRSFVLGTEAPRVGALLIHGMSDSPYSMRSLAERLHETGVFAIGLRVPGHGTAPSGLVQTRWQDMAAAVRLAMLHLRERTGDRPIFIVGYSNGGALAVEYALAALDDPQLPLPDRLVLLSPEIGVTKAAALAVWQERLGHLLGLGKLSWNSILPEYDPYKYGSFALNAGKQAYLITQEIQSRLDDLGKRGELERFPPTLAFQSVVDATVTAPVLVSGLLDRLPATGHELVLFDINRLSRIEPILTDDPTAWITTLQQKTDRPFTLTGLTNESDETDEVVELQRKAHATEVSRRALELRWPPGVYSLAHVSLPFPPDDPVYGGPDAAKTGRIQLGNLALRGERGVLQVGAADMLRLRWNPFHSYIEQRLVKLADSLRGP